MPVKNPRDYYKKFYRTKKSIGICPYCGTNPSSYGKISCIQCGKKQIQISHNHIKLLRLDALIAYGGPICICCKETTYEFLTIDHIDGQGNKHRKKTGSGSTFYQWLKNNKYPIGFQVLCMNCNFAKGHYGECPHIKVKAN